MVIKCNTCGVLVQKVINGECEYCRNYFKKTGKKTKEIKYIIDLNGCHNCYSQSLNGKNGYPQVYRNGCRRRDTLSKNYLGRILVCRLVYENYYGIKIPNNKIIRHKCDNRLCINPEHLEIGTMLDNAKDRGERGRTATSMRNGKCKLTDEEVLEIFNSNKKVKGVGGLAEKYNISSRQIFLIKNRQRRQCITNKFCGGQHSECICPEVNHGKKS